MRLKRLFWFFFMILLGIAGGLAYGWLVNPVKYTDTSPATLRADYRADYVLMVATIYRDEHDLAKAENRLTFLGNAAPSQIVKDALLTAQKIGYTEDDLVMIQTLSFAIDATTQGGKP